MVKKKDNMKKIILGLLFAMLISFFAPQKAGAAQVAGASARLKTSLDKKDTRIEKLSFFLEENNSPLTRFAGDFIKTADKYKLDWRLVAAITGVESTFGKRIPLGSFNAYGWGNGKIYFESWSQSIEHVSSVLAEKYVAKGLDTPQKMASVYAPPSQTWGSKVNYFMEKIDQTHSLSLTL